MRTVFAALALVPRYRPSPKETTMRRTLVIATVFAVLATVTIAWRTPTRLRRAAEYLGRLAEALENIQ